MRAIVGVGIRYMYQGIEDALLMIGDRGLTP